MAAEPVAFGSHRKLEAAEREITHAALILLRESPASPSYDLRHDRARRAFCEQLADGAGFTLDWQHLDASRNIEASAASMRGDLQPMREMLDELVTASTH